MSESYIAPGPEIMEPVEGHKPKHHHRKELGNVALDGFTLMEQSQSQMGEIRQELEAQVIGQDAAVDAIIDALDRQWVRLPEDHRPVATLAFLGPTGVGKSEMAKALAGAMADGCVNLIKVDCSSYSQGHEITALTGAPPSYVGRGQKPIFNQDTVERPGTVVLFDEIEKGSDKLYNLMLQIMGDGRLQLNNGDISSFRDAVVIVTSNLGAKEMASQLSSASLGFSTTSKDTSWGGVETAALRSFREYFRPEFVNRLDKMVVFHSLDAEMLDQVLSVKLNQLNTSYRDYFGAWIDLSEGTRKRLIEKALKEPENGARPLVRALEEDIQTTFGRYVVAGQLPNGTHVRVFHADEVPGYSGDDSFVFASRPDPQAMRYFYPFTRRELVAVREDESYEAEEYDDNSDDGDED